jgi:hypothetical protein
MEDVVTGVELDPALNSCVRDSVDVGAGCWYGEESAPYRVVLVGDSVALGYAGALRQVAQNSSGQIRLLNLAMAACSFTAELIDRRDGLQNCSARKQYAVDEINRLRPDLVVVSNVYLRSRIVGQDRLLSASEWSDSVRAIVDKFHASVGKVAFLAPPPGDLNVKECFSKRSNTPPDCIGQVSNDWHSLAKVEQALAKNLGGAWIDSRPWFCSTGGLCPSFVGVTVSKQDQAHITPAYGDKIHDVIAEAFRQTGMLP